MKFHPVTFLSIFFIGLGVIILIAPDLLAYTVAFVLISIGVSLLGWGRVKKVASRKRTFVEVGGNK